MGSVENHGHRRGPFWAKSSNVNSKSYLQRLSLSLCPPPSQAYGLHLVGKYGHHIAGKEIKEELHQHQRSMNHSIYFFSLEFKYSMLSFQIKKKFFFSGRGETCNLAVLAL